MFDNGGGMGILSQPATITNPLAPQQSPDAATLQAMAEQRAKQMALQKALYRAQVLREQPGGGFAQGAGPLGARHGVGKYGWMTTLGDTIAGIIGKKRQGESSDEVTGALAAASPADQRLAEELLRGDPNSLPRYGRRAMEYVPQGSPLSFGNE